LLDPLRGEQSASVTTSGEGAVFSLSATSDIIFSLIGAGLFGPARTPFSSVV
jgi:hypothetical protein